MALNKDTITINLAKTVGDKNDDKVTPPDQMAVVRDARFQKNFALDKRNGLTAQGTAFQEDPGFINPVTFGSNGPRSLGFAHENQLCLVNNGNLFTQYDSQDKWIFRGSCPTIGIDINRIDSSQVSGPDSSTNLRFADIATSNGITVSIARPVGGTTSVVYVVEDSTGNIITKTAFSGSENANRVLPFSNSIAIITNDSGRIYFRPISMTTGSIGSASTVAVIANPTVISSAITSSASTVGEAAFVLYRSGTIDRVNVVKSDGSIPAVGTLSTGLTSNIASITVAPAVDPNKIYVSSVVLGLGKVEAYTLSSTFSSAIFSTTFGTTGTNTNQSITMTLSPVNNSDLYVFHDQIFIANNGSFSDGDSLYISSFSSSSGSLSYSSVYGIGYNIASQCFADSLRKTIFLPVVYISELQKTLMLADMLEGKADKSTFIVGKTLYGIASVSKVNTVLLQQCAPLSGSSSIYRTTNNGYFIDFNLIPDNCAQSQYYARTTHITGGILWSYDGLNINEHNFLIGPENFTLTGTTGGALAAGAYQVTFVYRWTDRNGQVYRSLPAVAKTGTTAGTGSIVYNIWAPPITNRRVSDVGFEVYATANNQSTFFFVDEGTWSASTANYTGTITAAGGGTRQLYTTGGILENATNIGACSSVWFFKERLCANAGDDPQAVFYSKTNVVGEPVNFAQELNFRVDADEKEVSAGIQMDDKMIVCKEDKIYVLSGDGANDLGQGDTFQPPMLVAADIGCGIPNSMVLYSNGVIFSSNKGIYNLSRGLSTAYIGDRVEDYNSFRVASGVLMDNLNEIRYCLQDGSTGLVYNYYFDRWDLFSNYQSDSGCIWQESLVLAKASGKVLVESDTNYYDVDSGTQSYSVYCETPWLKLKGIQDFQRIYALMFLGEYFTPNSFKVELSYDYIPTVVDTFTFDSAIAVANPPYQFEVFPTRQKCQSIKIAITVIPSTGSQRGIILNELGAVVGLKSGLNKLPAVKRA